MWCGCVGTEFDRCNPRQSSEMTVKVVKGESACCWWQRWSCWTYWGWLMWLWWETNRTSHSYRYKVFIIFNISFIWLVDFYHTLNFMILFAYIYVYVFNFMFLVSNLCSKILLLELKDLYIGFCMLQNPYIFCVYHILHVESIYMLCISNYACWIHMFVCVLNITTWRYICFF